MSITDVGFAGVRKIQLDPARDERGSFVRFFCRRTFQDAGLNIEWPQTNFSHTFQRGLSVVSTSSLNLRRKQS